MVMPEGTAWVTMMCKVGCIAAMASKSEEEGGQEKLIGKIPGFTLARTDVAVPRRGSGQDCRGRGDVWDQE